MFPVLPRLFCAVLFVCAAAGLRAAASAELPPATTLLASDDFAPTDDEGMLVLKREGQRSHEGAPVWSARSTEAAKDAWLAQLKGRLEQPVKKGEAGLIIVQARAVETSHESDQAQLRLVVADEQKPFPRIAVAQFSVGREWRELALPFAFGRDHAAGEVFASVDLGYGRQTIELAGLRLLNFGDRVPVASLPRTRMTYAGHEPDAVWRREALARIERIRKGGFALLVTGADGRPAADADVRVELRSHAFQFGTVVNVDTLSQDTPEVAEYRRRVLELFNAASTENALKWANWNGEGKPADYRERTMRELAWLRENGLALRGHVMVWPGWRFLPRAITALRGKPGQERIPEMALAHIRDIAVSTKDYISEWDVLNEPVSNHDLMDLFGREIMVDWFKEAGAALPGVPLFLNDWGNHDQRQSPAHTAQFEETALYLRERGAPLGGIGLQAHIGGVLSAPADVLATLDRYVETLGLPVRITEFDVTVDDEEIQADYTRDFFIAAFSHPSVIGVQQWGFWEGKHWQPKAALYRKDWSEKPNGAAYRKLVKETWHTDESGRTDAAGRWETRGFFGRYVVTVRRGDRVHEVEVSHRMGATEPVRIALPEGF